MSRTGPLWEMLDDIHKWEELHFSIWLNNEVPFKPAWRTNRDRKRTAHGFAGHERRRVFQHSRRGA